MLGVFSTPELALDLIGKLTGKRVFYIKAGSYAYQMVTMEVDKHYIPIRSDNMQLERFMEYWQEGLQDSEYQKSKIVDWYGALNYFSMLGAKAERFRQQARRQVLEIEALDYKKENEK